MNFGKNLHLRRLSKNLTQEELAEMNLAVNLEYVTDMQKIMEAGVMSMPALMVNDKVVSCGKVLKVDEVKKLLSKV